MLKTAKGTELRFIQSDRVALDSSGAEDAGPWRLFNVGASDPASQPDVVDIDEGHVADVKHRVDGGGFRKKA